MTAKDILSARVRRRAVLVGAGATLTYAAFKTDTVLAQKKYANKARTASGRSVPYSGKQEPWNPYFNVIGEPLKKDRPKPLPFLGNALKDS